MLSSWADMICSLVIRPSETLLRPDFLRLLFPDAGAVAGVRGRGVAEGGEEEDGMDAWMNV